MPARQVDHDLNALPNGPILGPLVVLRRAMFLPQSVFQGHARASGLGGRELSFFFWMRAVARREPIEREGQSQPDVTLL